MRRVHLSKILFLTLFWALAAAFLVSYDTAVESAARGSLRPGQSFWRDLAVAVAFTLVAGAAMATFEVLYLSKKLRKRPYWIALATSTTFYLTSMLVVASLAVLTILALENGLPPRHPAVLTAFSDFVLSPRFLMTMLYWGGIVLLGLFILLVAEKFGHGLLVQMLTGRYHQPKQEHRIFMFLDLKSSTTIAERLGHIRYSELLQDCFRDITDVVVRNRAQIYQYVGDEAVLSWDAGSGGDPDRCLKMFYDYEKVLQSKAEYYRERYGVVPEFKAGVNAGLVTAAEIGEIKKDLAYHGDVLNTAARIQAKCNELGRRLLVSKNVVDLVAAEGFRFDPIGELDLRGKSESVAVFAVDRSGPSSSD